MVSISSSGIGSGLDINGLVQQLVAAERQPTELRIARLEARAQSKLSAFGSLKSALSGFKDQLDKMTALNALLPRKASSADETLLTVSVSTSAQPASYSVEVLQLAQAQKLQSAVFGAATTAVGIGTLNIVIGSDSFSLIIDSSNNTVAGIRDAINNALDNKGVSASIVNGDTGSFLTLSAENTGLSNAMIITQSGGDGGLSALEYDPPNALNSLTQTLAALDASIEIDGVAVTDPTNTITDAVGGVTLKLVKVEVGTTTQIKVESDKAAVVAEMDGFINKYNQLIDTLESLSKFDVASKSASALFGDSIIRGVRNELRQQMSSAITGISANFSSLNEIGFDFEINGKLKLDSTKLDGFLETEFSKVGQLFTSDDGMATLLGIVVDAYLDADDGIIAARVDGLDISIKDFVKQREALNRRMIIVEARLKRQFIGLDTLIGELTSTSNFLSQQLQNLPGVSFINN